MSKVMLVLFCSFLCVLPSRGQLLSKVGVDSVEAYVDLELALNEADNAYSLDLSGRKLREVPPEIAGLTNLNILDLSRNKLRTIPSFIGELPNLQVLRLSKNRLKDFPEGICQLTNLDHLDLGKNNIDSIPPCIGRLKRLRVLDLWGNLMGGLPKELGDISTLRYVDMRVIALDYDEIDAILGLIPQAKVYYSEPCNCK